MEVGNIGKTLAVQSDCRICNHRNICDMKERYNAEAHEIIEKLGYELMNKKSVPEEKVHDGYKGIHVVAQCSQYSHDSSEVERLRREKNDKDRERCKRCSISEGQLKMISLSSADAGKYDGTSTQRLREMCQEKGIKVGIKGDRSDYIKLLIRYGIEEGDDEEAEKEWWED